MKTSTDINELAAALAAAQGEMRNPLKDSDNPFFKSKYADLAANIDAARPALAKHGIACVQTPYSVDGAIGVITRLIHASGQWIESDALSAMPKDSGPQAVGTCVTYLRRYQYAPMVGLAAEDDDGNASNGVAGPPGKYGKHEATQRRPPGTVSRKETQPDHAAANAALEAAGAELFQGDEPREAASKRSQGIAAAMAMVEVGQAKGLRDKCDQYVKDGLMTPEDKAAVETAIVARTARLAGLTTGDQLANSATGSPAKSDDFWLDYNTALVDAVTVDDVAKVRDFHLERCQLELDKMKCLQIADARFAKLKPAGKKKQAVLTE